VWNDLAVLVLEESHYVHHQKLDGLGVCALLHFLQTNLSQKLSVL
jgi:hypothetical protein